MNIFFNIFFSVEIMAMSQAIYLDNMQRLEAKLTLSVNHQNQSKDVSSDHQVVRYTILGLEEDPAITRQGLTACAW